MKNFKISRQISVIFLDFSHKLHIHLFLDQFYTWQNNVGCKALGQEAILFSQQADLCSVQKLGDENFSLH